MITGKNVSPTTPYLHTDLPVPKMSIFRTGPQLVRDFKDHGIDPKKIFTRAVLPYRANENSTNKELIAAGMYLNVNDQSYPDANTRRTDVLASIIDFFKT